MVLSIASRRFLFVFVFALFSSFRFSAVRASGASPSVCARSFVELCSASPSSSVARICSRNFGASPSVCARSFVALCLASPSSSVALICSRSLGAYPFVFASIERLSAFFSSAVALLRSRKSVVRSAVARSPASSCVASNSFRRPRNLGARLFVFFPFYGNHRPTSVSPFYPIFCPSAMAVVRSSFGGAASKAFQRIADIHDSPTPYRAEFHAKIDLLSDLKAKGSTKYFHGFLADETGRIRFVSFYPAKRERFVEYTKTGEAVCFRNVLIKRNKFGNEMEAEIQESSGLAKSPQKISVSTHLGQVPETPVPATLDEVGRFLPG
ncbi:uncharacterized protein [Oscarella lobularis]|uniref:uncharacterized protein isoform X2 n=1 Tax=Oscarella lobularis TaxID=121494 RepID=UPI00331393D4